MRLFNICACSRCKMLLGFALFFLVVGCSHLGAPTDDVAAQQVRAWPQRMQQLSALQTWQAQGKINIRHANQAWTFNVHWQQIDAQHYLVHFFAPLGGSVGQLRGTPQLVEFTSSKGEVRRAKDAQTLLSREFGWQLPVAQLSYWLRGLPAPGQSQKTLDPYQRLATLSQQDWQVTYRAYQAVGPLALPRALTIRHPDWVVRLVVTSWER